MAVSDYYSELGVSRNASADEIKSAYRKMAMRWHPDRWTKATLIDQAEEAKKKFQGIQEAYSVLSDARKRTLYDAGLYDWVQDDANDDQDGMADFLEELFSLMEKERKTKKKTHSLVELQDMLAEMMRNSAVSGEQEDGSWSDPWFGWSSRTDGPRKKRRARMGSPAAVYGMQAKSRCRTVRVGGVF